MQHFGLVLNYLRDGECDLPIDPRERKELLREVEHYEVSSLFQGSCFKSDPVIIVMALSSGQSMRLRYAAISPELQMPVGSLAFDALPLPLPQFHTLMSGLLVQIQGLEDLLGSFQGAVDGIPAAEPSAGVPHAAQTYTRIIAKARNEAGA